MRRLLASFGVLVCGLVIGADAGDAGSERPLPSAETVVEGLLKRVESDASERRRFDEEYRYVRTQVREERNPKGELRHRNEQKETIGPTADGGPPREGGGRAYGERDVDLGAELVRRFAYEVEGREERGGRILLRVAFRPASDDLPVRNLLDRFINRTAGTLWLDEPSLALVQARMSLLERVSFLGGIAGVVYGLDMTFVREATPEGHWYTRRSAWQADYRQFLVHKVVEFREERTELERVVTQGGKEAADPPGAATAKGE